MHPGVLVTEMHTKSRSPDLPKDDNGFSPEVGMCGDT